MTAADIVAAVILLAAAAAAIVAGLARPRRGADDTPIPRRELDAVLERERSSRTDGTA